MEAWGNNIENEEGELVKGDRVEHAGGAWVEEVVGGIPLWGVGREGKVDIGGRWGGNNGRPGGGRVEVQVCPPCLSCFVR